jgi:hypothetical protein
MSRATGSPMRGRVLAIGAALGAILLIGGGIAYALVGRSPAQEPNGLCEVATNDAYAELVDRILRDYDAAASAPGNDAEANVGDAGEYGFTPLFQMRACSVNESEVPEIHDGLHYIIYDPEFHSDAWWAAPIDVEVAWYAELGGEGLIAGWSTIAWLSRDEEVGDIQRLLSLGLAHATNPDREAVLQAGVYPDFIIDKDRYLGFDYLYAFTNLGSQRLELSRYEPLRWANSRRGVYLLDEPGDWEVADVGPRVYGWSVLAPLLRFGDFHEQFLTPVATAIVQFDQERNGDWRVEGEDTVSFDAFADDPTNAMDAVLAALARNPAATEAVFEATGDQRVQALLSDG